MGRNRKQPRRRPKFIIRSSQRRLVMGNPYNWSTQPKAAQAWQQAAAEMGEDYANERFAPSKPAPPGEVKTVNGYLQADTGKPPETTEELKAYISKNDFSPLTTNLTSTDFGAPLVEIDPDSDDWSAWRVNPENVKTAAKVFVSESQDVQYSKEYTIKTAQDVAVMNGVEVSDAEAEDFYNEQYATRAKAILVAARIGKVKLTEAQQRRLQAAADGNYLETVYTTESSERGSLANAGRRKTPRLSGIELRNARETYFRNFGDERFTTARY